MSARSFDAEQWQDKGWQDEAEDFEAELDEDISDPRVQKDWRELLTRIKSFLAKNSRTLSISQLNKFMALGNFYTQRLKGRGRMEASFRVADCWKEGDGVGFACRLRKLARHYEIFSCLPKEARGGWRKSRSWLHDEEVRKECLQFLNGVEVGKVTPQLLVKEVNNKIFPSLNILPKKPIQERTARRWLIRLGWRHSVIKKGVYEDGHN
jgi:hypothetical protein